MKDVTYSELLFLTFKSLDINTEIVGKIIEEKEKKKINSDLTIKKDEINKKIKSYKKFITHKNKIFLFMDASEEYYSFKQYLNKFDYYISKYNEKKVTANQKSILAIKGLLLIEYFIEDFKLDY
jgi:hypothetical protein|tara:strand:- start:1594 stop:1965 length:372 start_codon:yes stop_codon:yes gene_type:complete